MAEQGSSSKWLLILGALVVGGSGAGVMVWQMMQTGPAPAMDRSGFDVQVVEDTSPAPVASARPLQTQSSLGSFTGGPAGMTIASENGAPPESTTGKPRAAAPSKGPSFKEAVLAAEQKGYNLAVAYTKKYPSIAQYGRDWMSYPDLRQLNYDYLRDRDPVKFMSGLAQSKNFPLLIKKYATDPGVHAFIKDAVTQAPAGLSGAVSSYLSEDGAMKQFVGNVAGAMGLPKSLVASVVGGDAPPPDQKQIMAEVMGNNPQLQKAMSNPNLQNDPNLQKALQGGGQR